MSSVKANPYLAAVTGTGAAGVIDSACIASEGAHPLWCGAGGIKMSMSKQDFIALADAIREFNSYATMGDATANHFDTQQINALADFCRAQNSNFMRERWLDYIAGKCGSNGGKVRAA